jgi:hypothetical protein
VLSDRANVPIVIVDDLGMRQLPEIAAQDLLEFVARYERAPMIVTFISRTRALSLRLILPGGQGGAGQAHVSPEARSTLTSPAGNRTQ